jgi:hypothetical protein
MTPSTSVAASLHRQLITWTTTEKENLNHADEEPTPEAWYSVSALSRWA